MNFTSDKQSADFLEVNKSTLSNWKKRGSIDFELLFTKCKHVSKDWLLEGYGEKQKETTEEVAESKQAYKMNP